MARIPNDLIADLRNALHDLGGASAEASDLIEAGVIAIDSESTVETVADGIAPHPTL